MDRRRAARPGVSNWLDVRGGYADAESYIGELVQQWSTQLPGTDGVAARDPLRPAGGIRARLDQRPARLLALTIHARSGVQRVLLGAAAASIVQASIAPEDHAIVFGFRCGACGVRGVLLTAYGPTATAEEAAVATALSTSPSS